MTIMRQKNGSLLGALPTRSRHQNQHLSGGPLDGKSSNGASTRGAGASVTKESTTSTSTQTFPRGGLLSHSRAGVRRNGRPNGVSSRQQQDQQKKTTPSDDVSDMPQSQHEANTLVEAKQRGVIETVTTTATSGQEGGKGTEDDTDSDTDSSLVAQTGQHVVASASTISKAVTSPGGTRPPVHTRGANSNQATASNTKDSNHINHSKEKTSERPECPPVHSSGIGYNAGGELNAFVRSEKDTSSSTTGAVAIANSVLKTSSVGACTDGSSGTRGSESAGSEKIVIIEEHRRNPDGNGHTVYRYQRGKLLGKGGFAKVYHCVSLENERSYAVKIVSKANLVKSRARQKLQAEIKIHRTLKHRHVCEFKHFFEDKSNCYILLELCDNQSMNELIKRRKRLTEPEVRYYMRQLLEAVQYMHDANVIHRDLKLGNLFLGKNLQVKVGDFGLATRLSSPDEKRKTICGTPNYIAPEVIDNNKERRGHSFEVDIWSMGVICFTTLVGKPPYESKDVKSTYQRILENKYSFPAHVRVSMNARDLISSMLQTNPASRPSLQQIANHPFLSNSRTKIPEYLPSYSTHAAPEWTEDEVGNLVPARADDEENKTLQSISKKVSRGGDLISDKLLAARKPLSTRDLNRDYLQSQDDVDPVRTTVEGSEKRGVVVAPDRNFDIYEEPTVAQALRAPDAEFFREAKKVESTVEDAEDTRTRPPQAHPDPLSALKTMDKATITLSSLPRVSVKPEPPTTNSSPNIVERETRPLVKIYTRLRDALLTASLGNEEDKEDGMATADELHAAQGAHKWVTRYVDYTSKYGLGFLFNDGSAGVYFNDSTKAVLAAPGETFIYVDRRKMEGEEIEVSASGVVSSRCDVASVTHTLTNYPENLQKKVTLLKHFRNYLADQQKRAEEDGEPPLELDLAKDSQDTASSLVYMKKWVRTKHAILFRLSNETVQVVFYDHTEVLLSSEGKVVTFVDKKRERTSSHLDQVMNNSHVDISKRLKYTRDILSQLVSAPKR